MIEQMQACKGKGGCTTCKGKACKPSINLGRIPRERAETAIAELDLTMVKWKLMDKNEGKGWDCDKTDDVEVRYKRFLLLNATVPNIDIVPTVDVDTMWHYHILDTQAYAVDCEKIFGEFFHHFPYFGLRGPEDAADLQRAFRATCALYEETFGSSYLT
ncbi:MAG: glycine-rich domain-containing protein-like [Patescibacteria group bacterium]|jgi:hypothetical protein